MDVWDVGDTSGSLDLLAMDTDPFGDWNDDGELFDQDLLKHDVVEAPAPPVPAPIPAAGPPAPASSAFQQYNAELAAHCGRVGTALTQELGRLGWAQRQLAGAAAPQAHAAALAACRERVAAAQRDTFRVLSGSILLPGALAALLELREQLSVLLAQVRLPPGSASPFPTFFGRPMCLRPSCGRAGTPAARGCCCWVVREHWAGAW